MIIDPANPANEIEKEYIDRTIKARDVKRKSRVYKKNRVKQEKKLVKVPYEIDGKKIVFSRNLIKYRQQWWVVDKERMASGSTQLGTKIKRLPYYYEKNASGVYEGHKVPAQEVANIIKIMHETPTSWEQIEKLAHHEFNQLRKIDKDAQLIVERPKIYLITKIAKGKSLDKYLEDNPSLTLSQRLELIALLTREVQRQLHNQDIYHLDLKPENIFYDEQTKSFTFIDFGSSQKGSAELWNIEPDFHTTTPFFDPMNHDANTPEQIDTYSLAGVFGCILSDWRAIEKKEGRANEQKEGWQNLPIFKTKNNKPSIMALITSSDPAERCYKFGELKSIYKNEAELETVEKVVGLLDGIGDESKNRRGDLVNFSFELESELELLQEKLLSSAKESASSDVTPPPSEVTPPPSEVISQPSDNVATSKFFSTSNEAAIPTPESERKVQLQKALQQYIDRVDSAIDNPETRSRKGLFFNLFSYFKKQSQINQTINRNIAEKLLKALGEPNTNINNVFKKENISTIAPAHTIHSRDLKYIIRVARNPRLKIDLDKLQKPKPSRQLKS